MKMRIGAVSLAFLVAMPVAAFAQTISVTAATDLNLRAGPDPRFPVVAVIPANDAVTLYSCNDDQSWCDVSWGSQRGWAYSAYLVYAGTPGPGAPPAPPVQMNAPPQALQVPVTQYNGQAYFEQNYTAEPFYPQRDSILGGLATGATGGAIVGALIAGPIGAVIGAGIGAGVGGAVDAALPPPDTVRTYVTAQTAAPVYLNGEVAVGATVPTGVTLAPVPDYQYQSAYINGQWVLVDPNTMAIVYVFR